MNFEIEQEYEKENGDVITVVFDVLVTSYVDSEEVGYGLAHYRVYEAEIQGATCNGEAISGTIDDWLKAQLGENFDKDWAEDVEKEAIENYQGS